MKGDAKQQAMLLSSSSESEREEEEVVVNEEPPPTWSGGFGGRKRLLLLSRQLSMRETSREAKWEKRRRQILRRRRMMMEEGGGGDEETDEEEAGGRRSSVSLGGKVRCLTDEDLDELRGSIELGFGFDEEHGGHDLCDTLPALDLYFAVNRQVSDPKLRTPPSPASTPTTSSSSCPLCGTPSPRSPNDNAQQQQPSSRHSQAEAWKICTPGENPQLVKTKLRHWAQAVACSVRQCC